MGLRSRGYSIITNNEVGLIAASGSAEAKKDKGESLFSQRIMINKKTGHFESISLGVELPNLTKPVRRYGTCSLVDEK